MVGDRCITVPGLVSRTFDGRLSIAICARKLKHMFLVTLAKRLQMTEAAELRGEDRMLYMWMVCLWGKPHASRIGTESVLQTLQGSPSARVLNHMRACSVAQLCPSLCDPMDCSPPGSSVHGIFQTRILESVAVSFSRGSSWPRDRTHVSWAIRDILGYQLLIVLTKDIKKWNSCNLCLFIKE